MQFSVISTSLNPDSKSRRLAKACVARLTGAGHTVHYVDLRETPIPLCDGATCWEDANVQAIQEKVQASAGVILAGPIYNWTPAASTKNLIECVGEAFKQKVVAITCAAGGTRGLIAPMVLVQSLMLDYQTYVVPKIVVSDPEGFTENGLQPGTEKRLGEMCDLTVGLAGKLG